MGLLGKSSRSLALWLTEVKLVKPDVILHECTVKFNSELLWQHLADYDIVHMKLSPVDFGWPAQRPRLVCRETVREGEVAVAVCRSCDVGKVFVLCEVRCQSFRHNSLQS